MRDRMDARRIMLRVCRELGADPDEVMGPSRARPIARARRAFVEAAHRSGYTYELIARILRRHKSTVHQIGQRLRHIRDPPHAAKA